LFPHGRHVLGVTKAGGDATTFCLVSEGLICSSDVQKWPWFVDFTNPGAFYPSLNQLLCISVKEFGSHSVKRLCAGQPTIFQGTIGRNSMSDYRVKAGEITEDQITALLESQSAKWPTSFFLGAAFASMIASLILKAQNKDNLSLFVGQWAAPFLILGTYNKIVKQHGSDATVRD
jgi:hypothetical protein